MAVLYRKYRPQTFAEVLDQKHIIQTLKNQVLSGSVAHAYLFTGSRGVGKTSVARLLAKAVNCLHVKDGEPDGSCENCKQIAQGNFVDLVEIDAASNTGVDNIRDLIEHVKFSPALGKYKVFIIDEVHMLSKGAFNALLKTLEEPPKHAIFILATTEIQKVPATIISRTQRFDFKRLSQEHLAEHLTHIAKLEKIKIAPEIVSLIAQRAEGGARDSLSLLDKVLTLGNNPDAADAQALLGITDVSLSSSLLEFITQGKAEEITKFFDHMLEIGTDIPVFNRDFLEYLRKLLIFKITQNSGDLALTEEQKTQAQALASSTSINQLIFIIRLFLKSYKDLSSSPTPDMPLLLAALEAVYKPGKESPAHLTVEKAKETEIITEKPSGDHQAVSRFAFTQVIEETPALPVIPLENISSYDFDSTATVDEVKVFWPQIVDEIKSINSPLAMLVRSSPIQAITNGRIVLGVKYLFHKQNIENQKNFKLLCDILLKITGKRLGMCAEVVKLKESISDSPDILGSALEMFGGEVVE